MNSIDRVDDLIRKNIMKHAEQKNQLLYEKQLNQYQKQRKRHALKSYAQIIKEGNKKAVEKAKEKAKLVKKAKNKTKIKQPNVQIAEDNGQNEKNKLNQQEIKKIQSAIQARAQRILQQKHLEKLDRQLVEEKKKTKLHELSQRCRKLAKSSAKIPAINNMPEERRKILEEFEKKALQQVEQLDEMINNILKAPNKLQPDHKQQNRLDKMKKTKSICKIKQSWNVQQQLEKDPDYKYKSQSQQDQKLKINFDPFQHPLFTKSTQQLLSLEYIPL